MKEILCLSANKIEIVYDPTSSRVATHFQDTPTLKNAVIEALEATCVDKDKMFLISTLEE